MASPDLPQLTGTPKYIIPEGNEAVASRISEFGNIVQNFTNKTTEFAGQQVGLKQKATEMVLKTNIDNSMRAFARASTNQFDPKTGLVTFEQQADEYTNKLLEGQTGLNSQVIRAYAQHAKLTNAHPLQQAVVKQSFNEAKMNFLASVDSSIKDISQNISQVPLSDALSHHNAPDISKPKGQVEQGNIDLAEWEAPTNKDGSKAPIQTTVVEVDGRFFVIPKQATWGEVISDQQAVEQFRDENIHFGAFKSKEDADTFSKRMSQGKQAPPEKREAPSIDSLQYNLSQVLNNIDAAGRSGLISPQQAIKLKQQVTQTANDEMLYHKYQLAVEQGHGDNFLQSYAKSQAGVQGAIQFNKHLGVFKKIENRNLAEHAISENTARTAIKENLNNLSLGKPDNTYADTLATNSPTLFPSYPHDKTVAQLSGGYYQQFIAGNPDQAAQLFSYFKEKNTTLPNTDINRLINDEALNLALKNSTQYFKDLKADPQRFLLEKNLLGSIAQEQKIQEKNPQYLPDSLKVPMADVLEASVSWQAIHGIPLAQASLLTNSQAQEFGGKLLRAAPADKVRMIQSILYQYGKYAPNIMQQLMKKGGVPREYGFFTSIDPESGFLPDIVDAITNPQIKYEKEQASSVKSRVSKAMSIATERAHPDVSTTRRFLGASYQGIRQLITRREFDATAENTGLFGSPALFPESSSADLKLKALTESYIGASGFKTGELINTIENTVNKLTNYYMTVRGLSEDDALSQATLALTGQYEMVDYRDNIIRMPKFKVNYNDLSVLLANTPEIINKIDWQFPLKGEYGKTASHSDQLNYYLQNIENGYWATDPSDQGLVWVNANGMINKMRNGNPLFISFESLSGIKPIYHGDSDSDIALSYANSTFELFQKNNVSFNSSKFGFEESKNLKLKDIPNSFNTFERMTRLHTGRVQEFWNYLFEDMQEKQRKYAQKAPLKGSK